MRILLIIAFAFLQFKSLAQLKNEILVILNGSGKTSEDARLSALRSGVEQAFGAFISSQTEVLDNHLIKDEIISVSSGNIIGYEVLSEVQTPEGEFAITLKAKISISKLATFIENKGVKVEFNGNLFASNIILQEFYEKNEKIAIENLVKTLQEISKKSFDFTIAANDPFLNNDKWEIPISINVIPNSNFFNIPTLIEQSLNGLSLSYEDLSNYIKLNKKFYPITLATLFSNKVYFLRNEKSILAIIEYLYSLNSNIINFEIDNGVDRYSLNKINTTTWSRGDEYLNLDLDDSDFRIILKFRNDGGNACSPCAASLFNNFCGSRHDSKKPNFNFNELYKNLKDYEIEWGKSKESTCGIFYGNEIYKAFYPLRRLFLSEDLRKFGLVVSFAAVEPNTKIVNFKFSDFRSLDELKKIKQYQVLPNN